MAEMGNEKYIDYDRALNQNDEASEEDILVEDGQSDPDEEDDGEDLDENLEA